jgi:2-C-methyl-D-erythritol 4-phosphate cytidylyltransferase
MKEYFVSAVVVAAGNSTRMGLEKSKQFIKLAGECVISHTLKAFENAAIIDSVVVVCRDCDRAEIESIIKEKEYKKVRAVAEGGDERADSVKNGILSCDEKTTHFAIHDGARPLIKEEDIEKVVKKAFETSAAALGTYVTDTIKVVNENDEIVSTPVRSELRAVQTPQVFEKALYLKALDYAEENKQPVTDDCKLVENIGGKVSVVIGSESNIKLTTKNDIAVANSLV